MYNNYMSRTYFENVYRTGSDVWSHIPYHKEIAKYIESMPGEYPYSLELGVGRGLSLFPLKNTKHRLFGLDTNTQVIRETKEEIKKQKITNMAVIEAPANNIPFTDSSFDLVCDGGLFTYLNDKEIKQVMNEIKRVLKPGGFFLHVGYSPNTTRLYGYTVKNREAVQEFEKFGVVHRIFSKKYLVENFLNDFEEVFHDEREYDSRTDPGDMLRIDFVGFKKK